MSSSPKFIKLSDQEVKAKTGVFLNRVTGSVWQLFLEDDKLMVMVPNLRFQISPLSQNIFIPANPLINIEFEFEKFQPNNPLFMHLYAKGIKRATFEAL